MDCNSVDYVCVLMNCLFQKTVQFLYKAIELGNLQGLRGQLHAQFATARDGSGRTLLHTAVLYERHFIIIFLLKRHPEIVNQTDVVSMSIVSKISVPRL